MRPREGTNAFARAIRSTPADGECPPRAFWRQTRRPAAIIPPGGIPHALAVTGMDEELLRQLRLAAGRRCPHDPDALTIGRSGVPHLRRGRSLPTWTCSLLPGSIQATAYSWNSRVIAIDREPVAGSMKSPARCGHQPLFRRRFFPCDA
jgi:hypothetical protein